MTITNITMLTYGRPRLTNQAIESLVVNTTLGTYTLTEFNDDAKLGTGPARNKVIEMASQYRGDYLYLSDNDVYFKPGWLETLIECYEWAKKMRQVLAIGAYNHPYHQPVERWRFYGVDICKVYALSFQSWLMEWSTWDRFGKINDSPPGVVRFSEDWEYSQRIRNAGYEVATVLPPLIYPTGVTDSFGKVTPGSELFERPEGVIVE